MYRFRREGGYVIRLPGGGTKVIDGEDAAQRAKEYIDRSMGWDPRRDSPGLATLTRRVRHVGQHPGVIPVYSLTVVRRTDRDPVKVKKAAAGGVRVPIFKVVLRKEGSIRLPETHVTGPDAAARVAHKIIGDSPFEKSLAILINSAGEIVGAIVIGTTSSIASAAVSVRGVFTAAIAHNAAAIILAHNHPSGDPTPSEEDLAFTQKIAVASDVMHIPILDHLIVTRDPKRWRSFRG